MSAIEGILTVATPDIIEAVRWLVGQHAEIVSEDPPHGMAFAGLEFVVGAVSVRMVRDRGVWMMELRRGEERWLDFELLRLARQGREIYPLAERRAGSLPPQIPVGVSWRSELPDAIDWLNATEDAKERCAQLARSRSALLFPKGRHS